MYISPNNAILATYGSHLNPHENELASCAMISTWAPNAYTPMTQGFPIGEGRRRSVTYMRLFNKLLHGQIFFVCFSCLLWLKREVNNQPLILYQMVKERQRHCGANS